jgi:hypothetical protein
MGAVHAQRIGVAGMITKAQLAGIIASLVIAAGIALAGWFVGHGVSSTGARHGTVTVNGVAERAVQADRAVWPLRLTATADVLKTAQAELDSDRARLMTFLSEAGFVDASVTVKGPLVTDLNADPTAVPDGGRDRYIVSQTVVLRTPNVELVQDAAAQTRQLVRQGVSLGGRRGHDEQGRGPRYLYTRLDEVRPAMLAKATMNARATAEQFAADAGARLGRITGADQGAITVTPRSGEDAGPVWTHRRKTVRVVSTVTFRLSE